jgi:hypothetical protein
MDDPAPELEEEAQLLGQRAWVAGRFYNALRANGIPDALAHEIVQEWYSSELETEQVSWRDLGDDG